jgi:hypothetical protein
MEKVPLQAERRLLMTSPANDVAVRSGAGVETAFARIGGGCAGAESSREDVSKTCLKAFNKHSKGFETRCCGEGAICQ